MFFLTGVVDADHYVSPAWMDSIRDADKILNYFSKFCYKAKKLCAIYRDGDSETDINNRFQHALDSIAKTPLTFTNHDFHDPIIITIDDLKPLLFGALYSPVQVFPFIAVIAKEILEGRPELLSNIFVGLPPIFFCGPLLPSWAYPTDAQAAIMCSDKKYPVIKDHISFYKVC